MVISETPSKFLDGIKGLHQNNNNNNNMLMFQQYKVVAVKVQII